MDSIAAFTGLVYAATAYLMAYVLYLIVTAAGNSSIMGFRAQPYDANRLVLRNRYV